MNSTNILLAAAFAISALMQNIAACIGIAMLIYAIYIRKMVRARKSDKTENMEMIIGDFSKRYAQHKSAIKAAETVSSLFGPNKAAVCGAVKSARLGAQKIKNSCNVGSQCAKFIGTLANGMTSGRDISQEIDIMLQKIRSTNAHENLIREKTEGMHVISQLGISFFFPMFAGISSNIMQASLSAGSLGSTSRTFVLSVMLYIGTILFITSSFKNPKSPPIHRISAVVPLFVTGVLVFLLASSFSSVL